MSKKTVDSIPLPFKPFDPKRCKVEAGEHMDIIAYSNPYNHKSEFIRFIALEVKHFCFIG